MDRIEYQISKEVQRIKTYMMQLKQNDLQSFCELRDELKRDTGEEFYNKYFKEEFEI